MTRTRTLLEEPVCCHSEISDEPEDLEKDNELEDEIDNDGSLSRSLFFGEDEPENNY